MPRRVGAASSPMGMTSSPSDMSIFSHNEEDMTELLADVAEETAESGGDNEPVPTSDRGANNTDTSAVVSANNADADSLSKELLDAFYLGTGNFLLAYNTRAGISVLMRIFRLLSRRKFAQIFDLPTLLDEKQLSFRVEAVSMGLFLGWFTGGYRALKAVLPRAFQQLALRRQQSQKNQTCTNLTATEQRVVDEASTLVAGAAAACAIGFVNAKRRRSLALYALTRALQCGYNTAKGKGYWHFWGSKWKYGDSLLFALSSAQIMYAFIMRPTTLPTDYFRFIQKTGPVEKEVLEIVRQANRGLTLDPAFVQAFIDKRKVVVDFPVPRGCPTSVSCRMIHHHDATCVGGTLNTFRRAFVSAFPLYLSLFIVPSVVIHFKKFLSRPFSTLGRAVLGATRSNSFLASFVALYMASICVQRRVMTTDHRFVYYVAGLLASVSILIEPKSRRSELALYVLPRAIDSLYIILNDRKIFTGVKNGDVLVFALSMACMMHSYEHEKDSMGPFLYSTLKRFLHSPTDKKKLFLAGLEQQQRAKRDHQHQQSTAVVPVDAPAP